MSVCEKITRLPFHLKMGTFRSEPISGTGRQIIPKVRYSSMITLFATARAVCAVFLSVLTIGACSNTQISTELPLNHPANPAAEASAFVPPPNHFTTDVSLSEPGRPRSDIGKPKQQQVGTMPQHDMQTMQPEKDPHDSIPEKKSDHRH
jgi:hypothetical protein